MTLKHTVNLGNSIIGVSLLAMPFCFKRCGIVLSVLLVLLSAAVNRAGCHLLLRSAMISKRRNFELLAYQTYGTFGKFLVEFGVLGFLLGSCVAFFVVIGDLGSSLIAELFSIPNGPHLRAFILTFLGMFIALPLGLLRRVDSLTSFSALSLGLYLFLILKLFIDAFSHLSYSQKPLFESVNLWNTSSLFTSLPIFVMALSCQPQLFEIFDSASILSEDNNSIRKMNRVIKDAVNICSGVYIAVGIFGYLAFFDEPFRGNVLVFLTPSFTAALTKIGFIFTVIISLPLCLFPCRTSLHSLLFRKGTGSLLNEISTTQTVYMSDRHFTILTIILIVTTIGISVLLPHIEIVLGIIGSTIGAVICFILPAAIFLNLKVSKTVYDTERFMANAVFYIGIFILIACSYSTLKDAKLVSDRSTVMESLKTNPEMRIASDTHFIDKAAHRIPNIISKLDKNSKTLESKDNNKDELQSKLKTDDLQLKKNQNDQQKQSEIQSAKDRDRKQDELLRKLEKQQEENKKLLEQQKQILQEMKRHEELHKQDVKSLISPTQKVKNIPENTEVKKEPEPPKNVIRKSKVKSDKTSDPIKVIQITKQANKIEKQTFMNGTEQKINFNPKIDAEKQRLPANNLKENLVTQSNSEAASNEKVVPSKSDLKSKNQMLPKKDLLAVEVTNNTQL
ncbi:putative sodium-coupled neutral amino acid transporter 10-like protein [Dinothrombium tinctorium]|uniref:Putative sodium-coupled neutral amino acid transporter 10-like protein n=1 Tax=Dinothrombium tinctorium TaxID=1965070 RepID=A0A443RQZ5_9ACAR|nr:putative sodium-coupled neutral amino acid transporter 10-like protein [Dinothrombium tinctorium]